MPQTRQPTASPVRLRAKTSRMRAFVLCQKCPLQTERPLFGPRTTPAAFRSAFPRTLFSANISYDVWANTRGSIAAFSAHPSMPLFYLPPRFGKTNDPFLFGCLVFVLPAKCSFLFLLKCSPGRRMLAPSCGVMRAQKSGFYETLFSFLNPYPLPPRQTDKKKNGIPRFHRVCRCFQQKNLQTDPAVFYRPNTSLAFFIRSMICTENGQFFSQLPQAMQSDACADSAA